MDVDSVFNMIKDMFIKYKEKYEQVYNIVRNEIGDTYIYDYYYNKWGKRDVSKVFKQVYGVDIYLISEFDRISKWFDTWKHANTYQEFLNAFNRQEGMDGQIYYNYPQFEIIDYHKATNIMKNYTLTETIGWYNYEVNECVEDEYDESIPDNEEALKESLLKLGDIGVHSECGWLPQFIVDELAMLSAYHCNHMG